MNTVNLLLFTATLIRDLGEINSFAWSIHIYTFVIIL